MTRDNDASPATPAGNEHSGHSRRRFFRETAKKALYIAPAVWVFTAAEAQAQCGNPGSACVLDGDCCSGMCNMGMGTCN